MGEVNKTGATSRSQEFIKQITELSEKLGVDFFCVTEGLSAINNHGNPAILSAMQAHLKWEKEHDMSNKENGTENKNKEIYILFKNGNDVVWCPGEYTDYGYDGKVFTILKDGAPVVFYNVDEVVCFELRQ